VTTEQNQPVTEYEAHGKNAAPAWWVPLAWGVVLPTLVCLVGYLISTRSRSTAGYFLLLWPIAAIVGMGFGSLAQMQRLFRTAMPTAMVFLAGAALGVVFLTVQAGLAMWLGSTIRTP
jgi:FtsH-binding integral membrane protein